MQWVTIQLLLSQGQFDLLFNFEGHLAIRRDGKAHSSTRLSLDSLLNFLVSFRVENDTDRPRPFSFHAVTVLTLIDLTMSFRVQDSRGAL